MRTVEKGNSIFTNVALTDDGDVWWEGMTEEKPAHLIDWKGNDWTPDVRRRLQPPEQPLLHPGQAVPDDGRRVRRAQRRADRRDPLRRPPQDHRAARLRVARLGPRRVHGATLSSETTAAATGAVGVVRRDPMAMLPFIGYNAGDYVNHWLEIGKAHDESKLPKIFQVNWFRRDDEDGSFLWPGFGDNARVLKWVVERLDGTAEAVETPVGLVPAPGALDTTGLDMTDEQVAKALAVNVDEWRDKELPLIEEWFAKFGDTLPTQLADELATLKARLESA